MIKNYLKKWLSLSSGETCVYSTKTIKKEEKTQRFKIRPHDAIPELALVSFGY